MELELTLKFFEKRAEGIRWKKKNHKFIDHHNYVITTSNEWIIPFSLQRELLNPRRVLY